MTPELTLKTIVSMVPNWYIAEYGPFKYKFNAFDLQHDFCTHRALTPDLTALQISVQKWLSERDRPPSDLPSTEDTLQEYFALKWLNIKAPQVDWLKAMYYVRQVTRRTYENMPVTINLIISRGTGTTDITRPELQKFLDQIAASQYTYLQVDGKLRFLSYKQIQYSDVKDSASYKFHPEFLHPYTCVTGNGEFSVHVTSKGDVIILDQNGLIAAKRKGHWKLYEVQTFKNSLADILGYSVGCNVFEILFDLSFKRHGALLIFDREHKVLEQIQNEESIFFGEGLPRPGSGQALIAEQMKRIAFGAGVNKPLKDKRLLLEVASIDGAVVFDDSQITAIGAIINPHLDAGNQFGARTTAALSAYHWGGIPLKVSSDGEVTAYFTSIDQKDKSLTCPAKLEFL